MAMHMEKNTKEVLVGWHTESHLINLLSAKFLDHTSFVLYLLVPPISRMMLTTLIEMFCP